MDRRPYNVEAHPGQFRMARVEPQRGREEWNLVAALRKTADSVLHTFVAAAPSTCSNGTCSIRSFSASSDSSTKSIAPEVLELLRILQ